MRLVHKFDENFSSLLCPTLTLFADFAVRWSFIKSSTLNQKLSQRFNQKLSQSYLEVLKQSCCYLGGPPCVGLSSESLKRGKLSVWGSGRGKIDVGGRYHFILLLLL